MPNFEALEVAANVSRTTARALVSCSIPDLSVLGERPIRQRKGNVAIVCVLGAWLLHVFVSHTKISTMG